MSAVLGVNNTKAADPSPANILAPGTLGGKKRVMVDQYEAVALASGSTIAVGEALPVGAIITGITLAYDALGGSSTLAVGDASSSGRYISAVSTSSAGVTRLNAVDGLGYAIVAATVQILITTAGASISGTVNIVVDYTYE